MGALRHREPITVYMTKLATAFASRKCACGAAADIVWLGPEPDRDMQWCFAHWPWSVNNGDHSDA